MRYGMNLLLWTTRVEARHLPVLSALADMGYDLAELPVFDIDDVGAYARLGREVRAMGLAPLAVTALGPDQNICADDPDTRQRGEAALHRMVDCAAALEAPILSGPIHSSIGVFSGRGPTPDELARSAEILARVAERGAQKGVRLAIEQLNRFECYLLNDTASAAAFAGRVGSNAGILYDTFHAHIEEKDPAAAIRDHIDAIALVHISENDRSIPGCGQVRWDETFAALKAAGYDGPLVVEAFGMALAELSAATRIWRQMFDDELALAREALAFMRNRWEGA
ncbi:sugar phosphate isomerase/epimerase [Rhodobacteraceae bacterium 2376]|uniref:Sugar phosphate isomerase/epimerase n=1 Tax=Rhabdonatronobacter sediminivivens TaxID=2743469 RepID=A0A7Z0I1T4_9RHOB|nr:sugar phosphate isomerase/epimerase family protein [Rhabdonatronobacter sediminivivens]NYS26366.1 sugar phosphate isomerase/epimerase [Rhabdonatronobacter sediminivivens]